MVFPATLPVARNDPARAADRVALVHLCTLSGRRLPVFGSHPWKWINKALRCGELSCAECEGEAVRSK